MHWGEEGARQGNGTSKQTKKAVGGEVGSGTSWHCRQGVRGRGGCNQAGNGTSKQTGWGVGQTGIAVRVRVRGGGGNKHTTGLGKKLDVIRLVTGYAANNVSQEYNKIVENFD